MKQQINELDTCIVQIMRDGESYLGCKISNSSRPDSFAVEKKEAQVSGYCFDGNKLIEWESVGSAEQNGRYSLFPYENVQTLDQFLKQNMKSAAKKLVMLNDAAEALYGNNGIIPNFQLNSVLFTENKVFFLSNNTLERFRSCHRDSQRLQLFDEFYNPDLDMLSNFSFFIASVLYKMFSKTAPFSGNTIGEVRHAILKTRFIPAKLQMPDMRQELADAIDKCLAGETLTFDEWRRILNDIAKNGWQEDTSDEQREMLTAKKNKLSKRLDSFEKWERFFRKYRFTLLVAGIIATFAGSFVYSMISKALEPPVTVGKTPRQVVEMFYESMNSFDHFTMEDTITKKAGKDYINEAVNLYALTKMRQTYEQGQSPFIDVQKWVDAGRPLLPLGKSVYGLANIKITKETENVFICEYEKWVENDTEETSKPNSVRYIGVKKIDRCTLEMQKNAWIITKIETLSEKPISGQ